MDVCEHCGACGRNAEYAVCVRCHEPHCPEHYYTPGSEPKWPYLSEFKTPLTPPKLWQYVRWGLHSVGPGCTKCLTGWAEDEEARLHGLIDGAGHEVGAVLQAVRHWPEDFPSPVSTELGRRWAAAAYKRQGRNRDLVLVCVTPKPPAAGMLPKVGIVEEIKRTPACQSKRNGRYGFTDEGDVFFAHGGGFVTVGGRAFVLVDRGKKVITAGGWRPGADDPDPASFRLKSGAQVEILPDWVRQTRRDIFKGSWQEVADSLLAD